MEKDAIIEFIENNFDSAVRNATLSSALENNAIVISCSSFFNGRTENPLEIQIADLDGKSGVDFSYATIFLDDEILEILHYYGYEKAFQYADALEALAKRIRDKATNKDE